MSQWPFVPSFLVLLCSADVTRQVSNQSCLGCLSLSLTLFITMIFQIKPSLEAQLRLKEICESAGRQSTVVLGSPATLCFL